MNEEKLLSEPYAVTASRFELWLRDEEGYRKTPYRDSLGKLTIGIGYNLDAGMPGDEALVLARYRCWKLSAALAREWPWYAGLNAPRQAALIAMAYQMGLDGLRGFKEMLAALATGAHETAAREALDSKWAAQTPARAQRTAEIIRTGQWP